MYVENRIAGQAAHSCSEYSTEFDEYDGPEALDRRVIVRNPAGGAVSFRLLSCSTERCERTRDLFKAMLASLSWLGAQWRRRSTTGTADDAVLPEAQPLRVVGPFVNTMRCRSSARSTACPSALSTMSPPAGCSRPSTEATTVGPLMPASAVARS